MRLICPNCGAQYEVADDVIPHDGRDVQCSNCGHTWFETPGASEAAELEHTPEPEIQPETAPAIDDSDWVTTQNNDFFVTTPDDDDTEDEPSDLAPATAPMRQHLDASVAEILQEEAAREEAARRAEAPVLESQTDMDLEEISARDAEIAEEARQRVAQLRGEDVAAVVAAQSRRELLPDIEEINSSLRSSAERSDGVEAVVQAEENRRGFRFSFFIILSIFAVLAAIYVYAPNISEAVPALSDILESYVQAVDTARLWLDQKMQGLVASMENTPTE